MNFDILKFVLDLTILTHILIYRPLMPTNKNYLNVINLLNSKFLPNIIMLNLLIYVEG